MKQQQLTARTASKHWDITLPLMKPYVVLVAVISAISATKVFEATL